jgi:NADPH-dependent curcumin reductase CurA
MNIFGRIALCGTTSQYNTTANNSGTTPSNNNIKNSASPAAAILSSGPSNLSLAVSHRLKLQGFIWSDHNDIINEFYASMSKWIAEGKITWKENIFEGLEMLQRLLLAYLKEKALVERW